MPRPRTILLAITALALGIRVAAALVVEHIARGRRSLCLFDDTAIYWQLAGAIRVGMPYEVDQYGIPHRALRTPGYPLFLSACQRVFGADATLGARVVQAVLGASCVVLVYAIARNVWPRRSHSVALVAAGLAAFTPYWAASAALLLSEAVFVPLMLATLWGVSVLWTTGATPRYARSLAMLTGLAAGATILVKPSWALAVPAILAVWLLSIRDARSLKMVATIALGAMLMMAPWWVRNERVFGRFVPTALWAGASLYDGLNPTADGSSDMAFLGDPQFKALGEVEQDVVLRERAIAFALANPLRVARLATIKAARFWSPWPNAQEFRASATNLASAVVTIPIFAMMAVGVFANRRDPKALALLAGPLLYFFAVHVIFVSSIRYRIPAEVPAFALASAGLDAVVRKFDPWRAWNASPSPPA